MLQQKTENLHTQVLQANRSRQRRGRACLACGYLSTSVADVALSAPHFYFLCNKNLMSALLSRSENILTRSESISARSESNRTHSYWTGISNFIFRLTSTQVDNYIVLSSLRTTTALESQEQFSNSPRKICACSRS